MHSAKIKKPFVCRTGTSRVKNALKKIDDDPNLSDDDRKVLVRSLRKLEHMEQYIFNTAHMKKIYGDVFVERFFSSLECNNLM